MSTSPLVRAAVQGLFARLAAASCGGTTSNAPTVVVPVEPVITTKPPSRDYDCCKGMNDCEGQSGCASSFNGCAGKNECKGKGSACRPGEGSDD